METHPRLHHCAQSITKGSLENVLEMYKLFNCEVVHRPHDGYQWAMVGQPQLRFALQLVESDDRPIFDIELKRKVHVAFLSDDPQSLINKIEAWAMSKNIKFRQGGWSDRERYLDLPEIFINFVVEIMHTSIEEG